MVTVRWTKKICAFSQRPFEDFSAAVYNDEPLTSADIGEECDGLYDDRFIMDFLLQ